MYMKATVAADGRTVPSNPPAILSYGFRPFFLFGAAYVVFAMLGWLAMLGHGIELWGPFAAVPWHAHEMIFGYLAAIIAGFALTAVPNWTGRLPVSGWPLGGLVLLWIAGRVASSTVPWPAWAAAVDCAFLFALAALVWREVLAARNLHNLPVPALITCLATANLLFHLEPVWPVLDGHGQRIGLGAAALLIGLIGGRIVPSFTRNWMARLAIEPLRVPFGGFDKAVMLASALAVVLWIGWPLAQATGAVLVLAGLLHFVRLSRWRGVYTVREPIVLVLHLGYLWLGLSFVLLGAAALFPAVLAGSTALHALTAGAIGTMTLAVMTRASLGHTGRPIVAGPATLAIYGLVTAGALLRVAAPFLPDLYLPVLALGGTVWGSAFAVFVLAYGPMLSTARKDA
jgi:uncharacterized protein involved in response to NO